MSPIVLKKRADEQSPAEWQCFTKEQKVDLLPFQNMTVITDYLWLTMIFSFIKHKHICLYKKTSLSF